MTAKQVTVMYTFYGDANIDGTVDTVDFGFLAGSFGGSQKLWADGDFNYDGTVDTVDFGFLASNFGLTLPAVSSGGTSIGTAVPEPIFGSGLLLGGFLLSRRRRMR